MLMWPCHGPYLYELKWSRFEGRICSWPGVPVQDKLAGQRQLKLMRHWNTVYLICFLTHRNYSEGKARTSLL